MPTAKRQMKLGVSMIGLGYHVAAWRHPDVPADGSPNIRHSVEVAAESLYEAAALAVQ